MTSDFTYTATVEEKLRVLTVRAGEPEQKRSKGLLGRLSGARGVAAVLALVLVLGGVSTSRAVDGNEYVGLSKAARIAYAVGAFEGISTADDFFEEFGGKGRYFGWVHECSSAEGWTNAQLAVVLDKFFADYPEHRLSSASSALIVAIANVCPSAPDHLKL